ncbi:MAG: hypothetical protein IV100_33920 [Myxococcales bacterium]|nr:hypothetical protein [Myxococcales bacterium]
MRARTHLSRLPLLLAVCGCAGGCAESRSGAQPDRDDAWRPRAYDAADPVDVSEPDGDLPEADLIPWLPLGEDVQVDTEAGVPEPADTLGDPRGDELGATPDSSDPVEIAAPADVAPARADVPATLPDTPPVDPNAAPDAGFDTAVDDADAPGADTAMTPEPWVPPCGPDGAPCPVRGRAPAEWSWATPVDGGTAIDVGDGLRLTLQASAPCQQGWSSAPELRKAWLVDAADVVLDEITTPGDRQDDCPVIWENTYVLTRHPGGAFAQRIELPDGPLLRLCAELPWSYCQLSASGTYCDPASRCFIVRLHWPSRTIVDVGQEWGHTYFGGIGSVDIPAGPMWQGLSFWVLDDGGMARRTAQGQLLWDDSFSGKYYMVGDWWALSSPAAPVAFETRFSRFAWSLPDSSVSCGIDAIAVHPSGALVRRQPDLVEIHRSGAATATIPTSEAVVLVSGGLQLDEGSFVGLDGAPWSGACVAGGCPGGCPAEDVDLEP